MGNEEGSMPLPSWGAADVGGLPLGSPTGAIFDPPSCDTVLEEHFWFYAPGDVAKLRSTCALINVYLTSVGRASNLILNMAPDASGGIQALERSAYEALGSAMDCLWRYPVANWSGGGKGVSVDLGTGIALLPLSAPRLCGTTAGGECTALTFVLEEELASSGQRIGAWVLEAHTLGNGGEWVTATVPGMPEAALTGVGHKRIVGLLPPGTFDALRVRVLTAYAAAGDVSAPISLRSAALFDRSAASNSCLPEKCTLVDW